MVGVNNYSKNIYRFFFNIKNTFIRNINFSPLAIKKSIFVSPVGSGSSRKLFLFLYIGIGRNMSNCRGYGLLIRED